MANASNGVAAQPVLRAGIGPGVIVTGDVQCASEMQIAGHVNGDVKCKILFVEKEGVISGKVVAEQIRISGTIDGEIETGDLAIEETGRASGNIQYARLKVTAGGLISGTLRHQSEVKSGATAGPLKLVDPPASTETRLVFGE